MSDSSANSTIRSGDVIAGKYRVERVIGQGGMGTVVKARHTLLEQDVAIKVLAAELASDPQYAARFLREAQTAVSIKGEHVVRVLDVGTRENGAPFMVMEYLEGQDLAAIVETSGPLHINDAVDYILQACEALAEAHVAGLTHRDIKPSNLFLAKRSDGSPLVKLLDFGIAKPATATDTRLTATGAAMGSPSYMSPEQVRNAKTVDHRSDIWSLGASLHEMLAGAPPFHADTFPALCAAIIADEPTPLKTARSDTPAELQEIINKCLDKKPEGRYSDVAALAAALLPHGSSHAQISVDRITKIINPAAILGAPAPRPSLVSAPNLQPAAFAATAVSTSINLPEAPAPKKKPPAIIAVVAVLSLAVVVGIFFSMRDKGRGGRDKANSSGGSDKSIAAATANPNPLVTPTGTMIAQPTPTAAESANIGAAPASSAPLAPGSLSTANRPSGTAKPTSTKSTKKNPNYDPFADQH
jgi:eukaryotic-like serine/threonine-protein kinase